MTTPTEADLEKARSLVLNHEHMPSLALALAAALAKEREKALDRLARAESIIAEKNKALRHIIEDARETTFGPVPKASTKHRKMAGYALALTLDEEQKP